MEVLSVMLAEWSCRTVCCDIDPGVAEARIRVDLGENHEAMPLLLARDDGARGGEGHHRVRVHIEDEPPGRPQHPRNRFHGRSEGCRREVGESVQRAGGGVEGRHERKVGDRRVDQCGLRPE